MSHALLIDGENLSSRHAPALLAGVPEDCAVRRVYGDAARLNGWLSVARLDPVHVPPGGNAADIRLAVDAMQLAFSGTRAFTIATSDSGMVSLIVALRERGARVTVIGEDKAPDRLREAGHGFAELAATAAAAAVVPPPPTPVAKAGPAAAKPDRTSQVIDLLCQTLRQQPDHALLLTSVNALVHKSLGTRITTLPQKNWRGFLTAHPSLFRLDSKGPEARVRLAGS